MIYDIYVTFFPPLGTLLPPFLLDIIPSLSLSLSFLLFFSFLFFFLGLVVVFLLLPSDLFSFGFPPKLFIQIYIFSSLFFGFSRREEGEEEEEEADGKYLIRLSYLSFGGVLRPAINSRDCSSKISSSSSSSSSSSFYSVYWMYIKHHGLIPTLLLSFLRRAEENLATTAAMQEISPAAFGLTRHLTVKRMHFAGQRLVEGAQRDAGGRGAGI